MLCLITHALAGASIEAAIPWAAAPYEPAGPERLARGPQYLAALPDGGVAFYDPVDPGVIVAHGAKVIRVPVEGATDLAVSGAGDLLVLFEPARRLELRSADGTLLDDATLSGLAPMGARLVVSGSTVYLADLFGNLHRGFVADTTLEPAKGAAVSPPAVQVRRDDDGFTVDGRRVDVPGALRASGRLVGEWLVVDAVVADKPLTVRRTAHHLPTGSITPLPTDGAPYAPRGELALAPDGALLVLQPRAARLEIWRVTP